MTKREKMIAAVTACIGTPFHHQGRDAKNGLDCIGLVIVGLRSVGITVIDRADYGLRPDGAVLMTSLLQHGGKRVSNVQSGDILVFRYDNQPQHVAVALDCDTLVHSFAPAGGVVASKIGSYWKRRLVAIYRFFEGEK